MSYACPVIQIHEVVKHTNADTLGIVTAEGLPVVVRLTEFTPGDLAVYVPEDSLLDLTQPHFAFLKKGDATHHRVKAIRLRGQYSEGLLIPVRNLPDDVRSAASVGADLAALIGAKKFEEAPDLKLATENEPDPGGVPYYDLESFRKFSAVFRAEEVVVTEKIHGCNSRFMFRGGRLWVGSHGQWKKKDSSNLWWRMAEKYRLEELLASFEGLVFYAETYGQVQDLKYSVPTSEGARLAFFDVYDSTAGIRRWFDFDEAATVLDKLELPRVPMLYRGTFTEELKELRNGRSSLDGTTLREGVVIRPTKERTEHFGRVVLKLVGEDYKLRKGGTERK